MPYRLWRSNLQIYIDVNMPTQSKGSPFVRHADKYVVNNSKLEVANKPGEASDGLLRGDLGSELLNK